MYQYTNEYTDSYIKLIYLRSRIYSPEAGRFLTKDSWQGDYNRPLSLNRWMYVEGNPINSIDPSGHFATGPGPWCSDSISSRVDFVVNNVNRIPGLLNTYAAAGIGVQCRGTNPTKPWDWANGGVGPGQITFNRTITAYGDPIGSKENPRGTGLRCWTDIAYQYTQTQHGIISDGPPCLTICLTRDQLKKIDPDYEKHLKLEPAYDANQVQWAVEYIRRMIQQVMNMCRQCSDTDIFIAAALGQNGPGLTPNAMWELSSVSTNPSRPNPYRLNQGDPINWMLYFKDRIARNGERGWKDTSLQLDLFSNVVWELEKRNWDVPKNLDRVFIANLAQIKSTP
jgi:RHS repeat-associated protein